jgi:hypothetical protein
MFRCGGIFFQGVSTAHDQESKFPNGDFGFILVCKSYSVKMFHVEAGIDVLARHRTKVSKRSVKFKNSSIAPYRGTRSLVRSSLT